MSKTNRKILMHRDVVGVGTLPDGYPLIMKSYHKKSDFIKMVRQIETVAVLAEFSNRTSSPKCKQYAPLEGVHVLVEERENSVYVEVICKKGDLNCGFKGEIEVKGAGFYAFLRQYQILKYLTVALVCQETGEEMHIFGLSNEIEQQVEVKIFKLEVLH
ncbi:hypothetical protein [Bacillus mycoides]|uniref:hypothetical protein n=1 Tax=Bacillus mycoides TaxID=1405 RepID=UPI000BF2B870|nr:hypothetical protein [Bacillus mycoides]MCQ6532285.1 hypothetical protein [Bacillus mycoides]PFJ42619.1 hypothetical protein COI99_30135 [Bacillus cereus]QWI54487.1 hypothetical protein EXW42_10110 [Bacillus mycoides]QWI91104.1 hypothetical protein J5W00_06340 [Bacillus mycoides]